MISLREITDRELERLWEISYTENDPTWAKYDAPFLHQYHPLKWEDFKRQEGPFFQSSQVKGIYRDQRLIGAVNTYEANGNEYQLEVGVVIFQATNWKKGYGQQALSSWINEQFASNKEIQRIGLVTWTGNPGMIKLSQKLNFQLEGRLRKVYFYNNSYFDALYYGCLREEWPANSK